MLTRNKSGRTHLKREGDTNEGISTIGVANRTAIATQRAFSGVPVENRTPISPNPITTTSKNVSASFPNKASLMMRVSGKQNTMVSAIRNNYKTSIYSMTIDQFTLVLFQNPKSPISRVFLLYKYCHVLVMLGTLGFSLSYINTHEEAGLGWHIFLDHWMAVIGSIEALCGVFTVTYFYHHCRTKPMRDAFDMSEGLSIRLLIYAIINSTSITFIFAGTAIFWFFICGENRKNPVSTEHTILLDVVLPASLFVKMNIENVPFTVDHFMYPILLMLIYFINVVVQYFMFYSAAFHEGEPKLYIFIYFNDESFLHFLWFMLESLLVTFAVHISTTLVWHSRWLIANVCCPRKASRWRRTAGIATDDSHSRCHVRPGYVEATNDLRASAYQRYLQRIDDLERFYRHDFIQPEWKHKLREQPSFMYLMYRVGHMILHFFMVFITLFEPEKPLKKQNVKNFMLWAFNFGNFFMLVSFLQSLAGFVVIAKAYNRKSSLKYYEQSELYVTGFQKFYSTINGCALALAVLSFATSTLLIDDRKMEFASHDYTFNVPHAVNPLSMSIDFLIVAHPYKFVFCILSFGILGLNIVFNYWLYHSNVTGRSGAKVIYDYLNWDEIPTVAVHIFVLYSILMAIHLIIWLMFLAKRAVNVAFRRRQLYRQSELLRPESSFAMVESHGNAKVANDLTATQTVAMEKKENQLNKMKYSSSNASSTVTATSTM